MEKILYEITQMESDRLYCLKNKQTGEIVGREKLSQVASWLHRDAKKKEIKE